MLWLHWELNIPNKVNKMKTSNVLKLAKKYLAKDFADMMNTNKTSFICYSIESAEEVRRVSSISARRVRDMITRRLSPNSTLESWLQKNHNIDIPQFDKPHNVIEAYHAKIQATRFAWVDSMIAEFEALGD